MIRTLRWLFALATVTLVAGACSGNSPAAPTSPGTPTPTGPTTTTSSKFISLHGRLAGTGAIVLLGTDAMSLHDDSTFQIPLFNLLSGGSALPILIVNSLGLSEFLPLYESKVPLAFMTTADFANGNGPITGYSALFFPSRDRCCFDAGADVSRRSGDIAAFVAAGGGLAVEDYQGNATWDATLHFAGLPGVLAGLGTDLQHDHPCINPGVSTPEGIAFGFQATYTESDGCFAHQIYEPSFWTPRGFSALQTAMVTTTASTSGAP